MEKICMCCGETIAQDSEVDFCETCAAKIFQRENKRLYRNAIIEGVFLSLLHPISTIKFFIENWPRIYREEKEKERQKKQQQKASK